eukprot:7377578-Prymnesium_polylepis.1
MVRNIWTAPIMLSKFTSTSGSLNESSVDDSTMATASLRTLSPKTIEKRSTFTPSACSTHDEDT